MPDFTGEVGCPGSFSVISQQYHLLHGWFWQNALREIKEAAGVGVGAELETVEYRHPF